MTVFWGPAERYALFLPPGSDPPRLAAQACMLWTPLLVTMLIQQSEELVTQNKGALKLNKEHSKLVKLAAKMSAEDYEHAGVDKLEQQIADAKALRHSLENFSSSVKAELGAQSGSKVLLVQTVLWQVLRCTL